MTHRPSASAADEPGPEDPSAFVRFQRQPEPGPPPGGEEPTQRAVVVFGRTPAAGWHFQASVPPEDTRPTLNTGLGIGTCVVIGIGAGALPYALADLHAPWPAAVALIALVVLAPVAVFIRATRT